MTKGKEPGLNAGQPTPSKGIEQQPLTDSIGSFVELEDDNVSVATPETIEHDSESLTSSNHNSIDSTLSDESEEKSQLLTGRIEVGPAPTNKTPQKRPTSDIFGESPLAAKTAKGGTFRPRGITTAAPRQNLKGPDVRKTAFNTTDDFEEEKAKKRNSLDDSAIPLQRQSSYTTDELEEEKAKERKPFGGLFSSLLNRNRSTTTSQGTTTSQPEIKIKRQGEIKDLYRALKSGNVNLDEIQSTLDKIKSKTTNREGQKADHPKALTDSVLSQGRQRTYTALSSSTPPSLLNNNNNALTESMLPYDDVSDLTASQIEQYLNSQSKNGRTLMHAAVISGSYEAVELMARYHIDVYTIHTHQNAGKQTALDLALALYSREPSETRHKIATYLTNILFGELANKGPQNGIDTSQERAALKKIVEAGYGHLILERMDPANPYLKLSQDHALLFQNEEPIVTLDSQRELSRAIRAGNTKAIDFLIKGKHADAYTTKNQDGRTALDAAIFLAKRTKTDLSKDIAIQLINALMDEFRAKGATLSTNSDVDIAHELDALTKLFQSGYSAQVLKNIDALIPFISADGQNAITLGELVVHHLEASINDEVYQADGHQQTQTTNLQARLTAQALQLENNTDIAAAVCNTLIDTATRHAEDIYNTGNLVIKADTPLGKLLDRYYEAFTDKLPLYLLQPNAQTAPEQRPLIQARKELITHNTTRIIQYVPRQAPSLTRTFSADNRASLPETGVAAVAPQVAIGTIDPKDFETVVRTIDQERHLTTSNLLEIIPMLAIKPHLLQETDRNGESLLHHAVKTGNSIAVNVLILANALNHQINAEGDTPLMCALEAKSLPIESLQFLLRYELQKIKAPDAKHLVKWLLESEEYKDEVEALLRPIAEKFPAISFTEPITRREIFYTLTQEVEKYNQTADDHYALIEAAGRGDAQRLETLLKNNPDIDVNAYSRSFSHSQHYFDYRDDAKTHAELYQAPLTPGIRSLAATPSDTMYAVFNGRPPVKLDEHTASALSYIQDGASIKTLLNYTTALHNALSSHRAVSVLCKNGADIFIPDIRRKMPLDNAFEAVAKSFSHKPKLPSEEKMAKLSKAEQQEAVKEVERAEKDWERRTNASRKVIHTLLWFAMQNGRSSQDIHLKSHAQKRDHHSGQKMIPPLLAEAQTMLDSREEALKQQINTLKAQTPISDHDKTTIQIMERELLRAKGFRLPIQALEERKDKVLDAQDVQHIMSATKRALHAESHLEQEVANFNKGITSYTEELNKLTAVEAGAPGGNPNRTQRIALLTQKIKELKEHKKPLVETLTLIREERKLIHTFLSFANATTQGLFAVHAGKLATIDGFAADISRFHHLFMLDSLQEAEKTHTLLAKAHTTIATQENALREQIKTLKDAKARSAQDEATLKMLERELLRVEIFKNPIQTLETYNKKTSLTSQDIEKIDASINTLQAEKLKLAKELSVIQKETIGEYDLKSRELTSLKALEKSDPASDPTRAERIAQLTQALNAIESRTKPLEETIALISEVIDASSDLKHRVSLDEIVASHKKHTGKDIDLTKKLPHHKHSLAYEIEHSVFAESLERLPKPSKSAQFFKWVRSFVPETTPSTPLERTPYTTTSITDAVIDEAPAATTASLPKVPEVPLIPKASGPNPLKAIALGEKRTASSSSINSSSSSSSNNSSVYFSQSEISAVLQEQAAALSPSIVPLAPPTPPELSRLAQFVDFMSAALKKGELPAACAAYQNQHHDLPNMLSLMDRVTAIIPPILPPFTQPTKQAGFHSQIASATELAFNEIYYDRHQRDAALLSKDPKNPAQLLIALNDAMLASLNAQLDSNIVGGAGMLISKEDGKRPVIEEIQASAPGEKPLPARKHLQRLLERAQEATGNLNIKLEVHAVWEANEPQPKDLDLAQETFTQFAKRSRGPKDTYFCYEVCYTHENETHLLEPVMMKRVVVPPKDVAQGPKRQLGETIMNHLNHSHVFQQAVTKTPAQPQHGQGNCI